MRICFFNRCYGPDSGATGQLLAELAEELAAVYNYDVVIIAGPGNWSDFGSGQYCNGVEVIRAGGTTYEPKSLLLRMANYVSYCLAAFVASFRIDRCDIVVALTDPPILGLIAWFTSFRFKAKFVFSCQDVFPEVLQLIGGFRIRPIFWILQPISRFIVRRADRIIAIGETMQKRLIELKDADPRKVTVIHNWADSRLFVGAEKRNPFSIEHRLAESFVVMHSGNIGLSQTLETFLDAAERLKGCQEIVFVLIGRGVNRDVLERHARDRMLPNVRFLPQQPKTLVPLSHAAADIFVISLKKGLAGYIVPSKLYPILASGRAYVAAVEDECEAAGITRHYKCGLLARPGDPDDLAEKILSLYNNREIVSRLGVNGRVASLHFDLPNQTKAYHLVLKEVFDEPLATGFMKRALDIAASVVGLFLSAPVWPAIAVAIKLDDGGSVFYKQERVGRGGNRFESYKFRSMIQDADQIFGPMQAAVSDRRVTRVGRILRASAMDELPQLWNIFKGDMSFVGPRPLRPEEIEILEPRGMTSIESAQGYRARHRVRPGLTGLAQVYARRDLPRRHKFRFDLLYIRRRSFCLDIRLIVMSIWISVRGKWEHTGKKL